MSDDLEAQIERGLQQLSLRGALPVMALILFLIAWNRGIALLYGMAALLVATFLIAYLAPRFNLRAVTVQRQLPTSAHVGQSITLEYRLNKSALRPSYMLELFDQLPCTGNHQLQPVAFIDRLKTESRMQLALNCELRGHHRLGPLQLHSSYPLGIYENKYPLAEAEQHILVYPATFPIQSLPLIGSTQSPTSGAMASSRAGGGENFFGIREYRHGDSPRHVHWASTAKRNTMVVKQYEYIQNTRIVIVLDLNKSAQYGEGKHSTLEYMVSIAASVAKFAQQHGHQVGLIGHAKQRLEIPIGHGQRHYQTILELLARVQAEGNRPYQQSIHEAAALLPQGDILFLFEMAPPNQATEKREMYQHHIRPLRVHFNTGSFLYPDSTTTGSGKQTPRDGNYYIHCGDNLTRAFAQ